VARRQISQTLDAMGLRHVGAVNGRQAWEELCRVATRAEAAGRKVSDFVSLVLTDVEMPEMDGFMLTRQIKADRRFAGIPVIMHSSLSGTSNRQLGLSVGVDEYVSKFEPQRLSQVLTRLLGMGDTATGR
jgi:two-component system chemotaxis response regulator CheV